ncbi:26S proteasome non-ATPase regulatory subunit 7, partial [Perkinsus olseni]
VGMRLLAGIKSCCCDALRTVMEGRGGLLDGAQVEDVVAGLMEDVSGRVVPVHGGLLLLGELEEPIGVPPSDWISSGAVLTVMGQGGGQGDEAKAARELLRSISDTLAVGLAVSERKAESIDTMVRSVLDSLPLVDFSSVEDGTQVVIPNDLRSVVLLRTLAKVAELLRDDSGESEAACFDKMMTLVEVALLKPLDGARLNAIMKLLVAVAPTFPERVRVLVRGIFDSSDCREEAVVNGCLAVDALTGTVDVWEEFSRSRSRLAYSTNPRLHFAVLSALRHGGTRALSLSVAHMVEESWDSRAAWEQHSRVLEACKESSPTALSLTLMRSLDLMAGETSETVSTNLLEYSVACVESNPEVVQRLCRQLITSEYYAPRRQAVSCLLQLTEKSMPVGAVEWGPALVRLYSGSAVRGEEGLCEEIDQLVRSMKHVQPRESLEEALEVLGGLALSPCAAASDNTFRRAGGHRRSRSLEAMRGQVMEDASSPVAAGGDIVAPQRPAVLLPRARSLAVRLLGVVVDNVEADAADGGSPEAVLRFTLTVANSSDEKTAGPSVDWNALYFASLELLHRV